MGAPGAWESTLLEQYRGAIGAPRDRLTTPALILDLEIMRRNIALMAERMRSLPTSLRPHTKAQKNARIAAMQIEAGAIGVCTATAWEAVVMRRAGIADVLVANQVVSPGKMRALAAAARDGGITVAVDDPQNAQDLSDAAREAGTALQILIEVDVGMRRGGVRSAADAVALAERIRALPGLRLRGVQGYEGHCMQEKDRAARAMKAASAMEILVAAVDRLERAGLRCEVVSAAGTGTYDCTGANPRITEIQAGSYVFMDRFHAAMAPEFAPALTVLATVASRHGDTVILDAGRKAVGVDYVLPVMATHPSVEPRGVAEEHSLFDMPGGSAPGYGDTVELIPGYAPTTVNLYDVYHVVEGGVVVDVWPIVPRGPGGGAVGLD
jgi:D-serine deaminase-like pyridoxal phosphate-dependent protein